MPPRLVRKQYVAMKAKHLALRPRAVVGILLVLVAVASEASAMDGLVFGDDPRRTHDITPQVKCSACRAVTSQMFEMFGTRKKVSEADLYDAMDGRCDDMSHFKIYDYIPPQMMKACAAFYDAAGDELEGLMYKAVTLGNTQDEAYAIMCDATVCKDVDMSAPVDNSSPPSGMQMPPQRGQTGKKKKSKRRKKKGKKGKGKRKRKKKTTKSKAKQPQAEL